MWSFVDFFSLSLGLGVELCGLVNITDEQLCACIAVSGAASPNTLLAVMGARCETLLWPMIHVYIATDLIIMSYQ